MQGPALWVTKAGQPASSIKGIDPLAVIGKDISFALSLQLAAHPWERRVCAVSVDGELVAVGGMCLE